MSNYLHFETIYTLLDESVADELLEFLAGYTIRFNSADIKKFKAKKLLVNQLSLSRRDKVLLLVDTLEVSIPHAYKILRSINEEDS